jgi:hypothetical protein
MSCGKLYFNENLCSYIVHDDNDLIEMSNRKSSKISMLKDTDDAPASLIGATALDELNSDGAVKVVPANSVNVIGALSRPEDTGALQTKQSSFFALFRSPLVTKKSNSRVAQATWGDTNPHFVSKLLVNIPALSHCLFVVSRI